MEYVLETARVKIRKLTLSDAAFITELLNSPGWLQFIGDKHVKTEEQAKNYLVDGPLKSYAENGYGLYLVEQKAGNRAIGMCGIIKRVGLNSPDIGFAFLPEYNGYGYASESAGAVMGYAKNELKLVNICAIVVPGNARSIRLLEKIGLKFNQFFCFPGSAEELLLFSNS